MLGAEWVQKYMEMKYGSKKDEKPTEVTEEEFIEMFVEAGNTEEDAKFHMRIMKGLDSCIRFDGKLVRIKNDR